MVAANKMADIAIIMVTSISMFSKMGTAAHLHQNKYRTGDNRWYKFFKFCFHGLS